MASEMTKHVPANPTAAKMVINPARSSPISAMTMPKMAAIIPMIPNNR